MNFYKFWNIQNSDEVNVVCITCVKTCFGTLYYIVTFDLEENLDNIKIKFNIWSLIKFMWSIFMHMEAFYEAQNSNINHTLTSWLVKELIFL